MLLQFQALFEFIIAASLRVTIPTEISRRELDCIADMLKILKPVFCVTEKLSGDQYVTNSMTIPLVKCMIHDINKVAATTNRGKELKDCILRKLHQRFDCLEENKLIAKGNNYFSS